MSRPIIATDVPGCREVVEDKSTGYLCKVRNVDDLVEKMLLFKNLTNAEKLRWELREEKSSFRIFNRRSML